MFNKIRTEIYKIQISSNYLKIINISYFFKGTIFEALRFNDMSTTFNHFRYIIFY